jgi:hypothetical protein
MLDSYWNARTALSEPAKEDKGLNNFGGMIIVTIIFRAEPEGNNGGGGLRKKTRYP